MYASIWRDENGNLKSCETCVHYIFLPNLFATKCLECCNEYFEETGKPNLYEPRDCLNCAHSSSDEQDRLHCSLMEGKIVNDDYCCEEWN